MIQKAFYGTKRPDALGRARSGSGVEDQAWLAGAGYAGVDDVGAVALGALEDVVVLPLLRSHRRAPADIDTHTEQRR